MPLAFGSLFAGIGGLDLGLERAGFEVRWQVEINEYATKVLEKHWPNVTRFRDVRDCGAHNLASVDLICGGFPCQPHSVAGKRGGAKDDRNLWPEYLRIVKELRPRYVLAENVPGIVTTYLDTVLSDLEGEAYTCATFNLPAVALDAPHRRERIFVVAHTHGNRRNYEGSDEKGAEGEALGTAVSPSEQWENPSRRLASVADASGQGCSGRTGSPRTPKSKPGTHGVGSWWTVEPDVGRVANGVPNRVDRLKCLGNAVVPQVAEWIGRQIVAAQVND